MDMTDPILQMLAYELAAIFAAFSIWLTIRSRKKNKQIQLDATKIVKRLKLGKDQRIDTLSSILAEKYGLNDDALTQEVNEFQEREQQIYKTLLTIFVEQDGKALTRFPEQLEKAIDASLDMLPIGGSVLSEPPIQVAPVNLEIDESQSLSEQIEVTALKLEQLMAAFRLTQDEGTELNEVEQVAEVSEQDIEI
ncbi:MAG: hypothetical protein OEY48_07645, partial [Gammaproteobacteria bacterium]|nr:hypothetical protein [Gammaproteobacteria bacterium]